MSTQSDEFESVENDFEQCLMDVSKFIRSTI